jgi:hypothetical protein
MSDPKESDEVKPSESTNPGKDETRGYPSPDPDRNPRPSEPQEQDKK